MSDHGREVRVPVESLGEAERLAWVLSELGATVEPDRFIADRYHVFVCTFVTPHRVLVMVRSTDATGAQFDGALERLRGRVLGEARRG